jgi:hypothetical protein
MKASQLIAKLQEIMEREGSDPICCSDLATTGPVAIKEAFYLPYEPDPANTEPPKWKEGQPLVMIW